MKAKTWIWTGVLAFLGYSIASNTAIENSAHAIEGLIAGAVIGFAIGWLLQRHDEKRKVKSEK